MMNSHHLRTTSITLCLFLLTLSSSSAQDSARARQAVWNTISRDVDDLICDASSFFTAPLRFGREEWSYTAGILGATALLFTSDAAIQQTISIAERSSINGDFWDIPTVYGSIHLAGGLTLTTYATGLITGNQEMRVTGRLLGESLLLAGIPTLAIKYFTARARPYTGMGSWRFNGFLWSVAMQSFPSGHASVAFAISTVLAERADNIWARVGLYGLASLTVLARVRNNQHWFSDVVVGAGLGLAAGLHVTAREEQRTSPHATECRVILYPSSSGLTIACRIN